MKLRFFLAFTLLFGALCAPLHAKPVGRADGGSRTEQARERAKRGYTLYDVGKYAEASVAFEAAYTLRPDAGLLFNAAQAARLGGDLTRAQTLYSSYVSFHPDGANIAEAKLNLEKIDAARKESASKPPPQLDKPQPQVDKPDPQPVDKPEPVVDRPTDRPTPVAQRSDKPLYKKWWFWTAIAGGVVVVGGAVALGVVLTRPAPAWNNLDTFGPGASARALTIKF